VVDPSVRVGLAEVTWSFSHVLAIEAKNIFGKSCGAPINRRWIVFSEDDDK
jgi:hypothetical protein